MAKERFDADEYAQCFGALSDPMRLEILVLLHAGGRDRNLSVKELMKATGAGQSRVSFHIKKLLDARLIESTGPWRRAKYCIYRHRVDRLIDVLTPWGHRGSPRDLGR